jgi:hypothetical protein
MHAVTGPRQVVECSSEFITISERILGEADGLKDQQQLPQFAGKQVSVFGMPHAMVMSWPNPHAMARKMPP